MVLKQLDKRIKVLIENNVLQRHRGLYVILGSKGKDQVVILHHILSKAKIQARPNVLWCYKSELGFSTHRMKKMKKMKRKMESCTATIDEDNPFDLFIASTNIRYCFYSETHTILGQTFGMAVLQDFEAITPNLLARTIETVEGGGIVCLLLNDITALEQLKEMTMDVHKKYVSTARPDVASRFNVRFLASLSHCSSCLVLDDQLNILPVKTEALTVKALPIDYETKQAEKKKEELHELIEDLLDTPIVGPLLSLCRTVDQAKAMLRFVDVIVEKTLSFTCSLTAARGRGKSAMLGLAVGCALAKGYSNIFVTAPSPENLATFFEFVVRALECLSYMERADYDIIRSLNPDFHKAVISVNVHRDHRQVVQYIHPTDHAKLSSHCELLVIDEAAAIPLPLVRRLLGPYLVFLSSTVSGYEGTGRSLSLKLLDQLRKRQNAVEAGTNIGGVANNRTLFELTLEESIRYADGDPTEHWLNKLLCLDVMAENESVSANLPTALSPDRCELYRVDRDTLFSMNTVSEVFLRKVMLLYTSSHYRNSPNDLQLLSDAPGHELYVLLPKIGDSEDKRRRGDVPEVLCVLHVCLEGRLSREFVEDQLGRGRKTSGDMIPWIISQQYTKLDEDVQFASKSGVRIVRIATHPDLQRMGYGLRAMSLLRDHLVDYSKPKKKTKKDSSDDEMEEEDSKMVLLQTLTEVELPVKKVDYLGVAFGLTKELLQFWRRLDFLPVYVRQTATDLTGEHSCAMLLQLRQVTVNDATLEMQRYAAAFNEDFRRRMMRLLAFSCFKSFDVATAYELIDGRRAYDASCVAYELNLSPADVARLKAYGRQQTDHHVVSDLLPTLAHYYFTSCHNIKETDLGVASKGKQLGFILAQKMILLGCGLQNRSVEEVASAIDVPSTQLLGLLQRAIKKFVSSLAD